LKKSGYLTTWFKLDSLRNNLFNFLREETSHDSTRKRIDDNRHSKFRRVPHSFALY
jgi:hypothetical protein